MKELEPEGFHVTLKAYDADHWIILSKGEEIVKDLEEWMEQQKA